MGKVKTVIMGDEIQEEAARKKAEAKREQKKLEKQATKHKEDVDLSPTVEEVITHPLVEDEVEKKADSDKKSKKKAVKIDQYTFEKGKKILASQKLVDKTKTYSVSEALDLVKKSSFSTFDGSVELHLNVADKGLRGTVSLPHGTGKQVKVVVATDELIEEISKTNKVDFDILVAKPDMMPKLAKVAKILGPKGLMPNPKTGTIGPDTDKLVKDLSQGQIQWKTQQDLPIIHTIIGKVSFDKKQLEDNYQALIKSIGKDKIKSAFTKATMGPSIKLAL